MKPVSRQVCAHLLGFIIAITLGNLLFELCRIGIELSREKQQTFHNTESQDKSIAFFYNVFDRR